MNTASIDALFQAQLTNSMTIGNRPLADRKRDLRNLKASVLKYRSEIADALLSDLNKPAVETDMSEVLPIKGEIDHALKNLDEWAAKRHVSTPLTLVGTRAWVKPEPKGVVLIISPWNFPFNLTFGPLASALAAGNCVVLKPSEATPASAALMEKIISETFPPERVCVVNGGPEVSSHLVSLPFHHIFFTGGAEIGKKVLRAAAEHLTPVTLELGGKSPAVVDRSANIDDAVSRILWARFFNSGQVCISPDYVLIDESVAEVFIRAAKEKITHFYGDPMANEALSILVNERHFAKITGMIDDAIAKGAKLEAGGRRDAARNFVEPTLLSGVDFSMEVMKDEIFGPILPIITWKTTDDALRIVNGIERPLAYYVFSKNPGSTRRFLTESRAGTTAINETFIQFIHPELPFGGVNFSGMGKAHGKYGFDTFSNERSYVKQVFRWNAPVLTHPPYTSFTRKLADVLVRWF